MIITFMIVDIYSGHSLVEWGYSSERILHVLILHYAIGTFFSLSKQLILFAWLKVDNFAYLEFGILSKDYEKLNI